MLILSICIVTNLNAQSKILNNWIFSSNSSSDPGMEGIKMHFGDSVSYEEIDPCCSADTNVSTISSAVDGSLEFYVTGCAIYNKEYQIMVNGDSLNYGFVWDEYCDSDIYPNIHNTLIVPDNYSESNYYILHRPLELEFEPQTDVYIDSLLYSYVDMSLQTGLGEVIEKNVLIDKNKRFTSGYLEAIQHSNSMDWWFLEFEDGTDSIHKYLIDESGPAYHSSQSIGKTIAPDTCAATSQACYSPMGDKFARYCTVLGLEIFDFDGGSGTLSNHKSLDYYITWNKPGGLAFSPSGQYLYLSVLDTIWQIDTYESILSDGVEIVGVYDGFSSPFAVNYHLMQLGPDCRIYLGSTSSTSHLSVIRQQDLKGVDCDFRPHGIEMPYVIPPYPLPNLLHLNGQSSACDPTITDVDEIEPTDGSLLIFPNPTESGITISLDQFSDDGVLFLRNSIGAILLNQETSFTGSEITIDLSSFTDGVYYLEYISSGQKSTGKVVKLSR